jgi:hypothetical protein
MRILPIDRMRNKYTAKVGVQITGMNFFWEFKDYGLYLCGFFSIIRKIG